MKVKLQYHQGFNRRKISIYVKQIFPKAVTANFLVLYFFIDLAIFYTLSIVSVVSRYIYFSGKLLILK